MYKRAKQRLEESLDSIAPDLFDEIQQKEIEKIESEEILFAEIEQPDSRRKGVFGIWYRWVPVMAAVIIFAIFIGKSTMSQTEYGAVFIDVNPSIRIDYEQKKEQVKVTGLKAVNNDGNEVLNTLNVDKNDTDLDDIVVNLLEELKKNKYLTQKKNEIIISYYSKEPNKIVQKKVSDNLIQFQNGNEIVLEVFYQDIRESRELQSKAEEKGISIGKYYYIEDTAKKYHINPEKLYKKSVHDINIRMKKKQKEDKNTNKALDKTSGVSVKKPSSLETTTQIQSKKSMEQIPKSKEKITNKVSNVRKKPKKTKKKPKKKKENQSWHRNENAIKVNEKNNANQGKGKEQSSEENNSSDKKKNEQSPAKEQPVNKGKNK